MSAEPAGACAVTGANGYVGSLVAQGLGRHLPVVALLRRPRSDRDIAWSLQDGPGVEDQLRARGVRTLVHCAWDMRANRLSDMRSTCVQGSRALFEAAARAGVGRIVFVSTISAFPGCRSAYGSSKLEVEALLRGGRNVVLRAGLVFGRGTGGVFGGIRKQVHRGGILPMIGRGDAPQYLLHEETLVHTVLRAARGDFDAARGAPITLAHPRPWPFRDLVQSIARAQGRRVTLVPLPWQLLYAGIRAGEALGLSLPFRSDSVVSFVNCDRHPDFGPMRALGIDPLPYEG